MNISQNASARLVTDAGTTVFNLSNAQIKEQFRVKAKTEIQRIPEAPVKDKTDNRLKIGT